MADRVLFISWGTPVRGSEERGLEVFNATLGLYGRMQQDGRIEAFDVMLFEPTGPSMAASKSMAVPSRSPPRVRTRSSSA